MPSGLPLNVRRMSRWMPSSWMPISSSSSFLSWTWAVSLRSSSLLSSQVAFLSWAWAVSLRSSSLFSSQALASSQKLPSMGAGGAFLRLRPFCCDPSRGL